MKNLIIYTSKYGASQRYAEMISHALGDPAMELKQCKKQMLRIDICVTLYELSPISTLII